jgi:hypothetical protein
MTDCRISDQSNVEGIPAIILQNSEIEVTVLEPNSTMPGVGLAKAVEEGKQLQLDAGQSLSHRICATVFLAEGEPTGVDEEGQVEY